MVKNEKIIQDLISPSAKGFEKQVKILGGWDKNKGIDGLVKVLRYYSSQQRIEPRDQLLMFDLPFFNKFSGYSKDSLVR